MTKGRGLIFLLFILFMVEYLFFRGYVLTSVAPFYPQGYDQTSYLPCVYDIAILIKKYGLIQGITSSVTLPTGPLFFIQAGLLCALTSISRLGALTLNFIYFALLQGISVGVLWRLSRQYRFVFLFLGCILLLPLSYKTVGSLYDFRIDFIAFCLYGITMMLIVGSSIFAKRNWVIGSAFFALLLMLTRILTTVYMAAISVFMWIYFLILWFSSSRDKPLLICRMKNLLLWDAILFIVITPLLWFYRTMLINYYVVGHITGQEGKIRKWIDGVKTGMENLLFYPKNIKNNQIGSTLTLILLALVIFSGVVLLRNGWRRCATGFAAYRIEFTFLLISIAVPLMALTFDDNKSTVVASIVVIPILLWVCRFCMLANHRLFIVIGSVLLCVGSANFIEKNKTQDRRQIKEMQQINHLYTAVGDYAVTHHLHPMRLSVDQYQDYLTNGALATWYFEQYHQLLTIDIERMGNRITAMSEAEGIESLNHSDVAIFQITGPIADVYPYDHSLRRLRPILLHYTDQHMQVLGVFGPIAGRVYRVYVK